MEKIIGEEYFKRVKKICVIEMITNYFLTLIKFIGGIISGSSALISDGVNSLGDIVTSTIALISSKASSKKADDTHNFGHAKIESLISLIFSVVLICLSVFLSYNSILSLINKDYLINESNDTNTNITIGLILVIVALITKFILFLLTYINGKKTKSPILKAQAIDHLSDSLSTVISLITMIVLFFVSNDNIKIIDPIASIIINILIIIGSSKILIENSSLLLDKSLPKKEQEEIYNFISNIKGVNHIDALRTRMVSNRIFIEVEISTDGNLSLYEAHKISENIREEVLNKFIDVKHILVHVNPLEHLNENDL